jgi:hypothetical protein
MAKFTKKVQFRDNEEGSFLDLKGRTGVAGPSLFPPLLWVSNVQFAIFLTWSKDKVAHIASMILEMLLG